MASYVALLAAWSFLATPAKAIVEHRDGPTTVSSPDVVPAEIKRFFAAYFRAVEDGEPDAIMALIDTDFVIKWPVGQPISDREQLRRALASLQQHVRQKVIWRVLEARVSGSWAWVRSTETPTHYPKAGGAPRTFPGSRLSILRKVKGQWLLHRDYGSLDALP